MKTAEEYILEDHGIIGGENISLGWPLVIELMEGYAKQYASQTNEEVAELIDWLN